MVSFHDLRCATLPLTVSLCLVGACKDDGDGNGDAADGTSGTGEESDEAEESPSDDDNASNTMPQEDDGPDSTGTTDPTDAETTDPDATGDTGNETGIPGDAIYDESFDGPDGSAWPAPWQPDGTAIMGVQLDGGRGRMAAVTNKTGRVVLPGFDVVDAEVNVVVEYENWAAQGFGFYVRQNGGVLQDTQPPGQGYGVYAEGGYMQQLGIWEEINGVETAIVQVPNDNLQSGVPYRIRFQCFQDGNVTVLRAKMWVDGEAEPAAWMVETEDDRGELQGTAGGFAVDIYNYSGTGSVWVDHVTINEL